jgi:hypothetical protein
VRNKNNLVVDGYVYNKVKRLNKETGQPIWRIIEMLIESANIRMAESDKHREPDICPECGSSDLLIQSSDYYWYCYGCEEDGQY